MMKVMPGVEVTKALSRKGKDGINRILIIPYCALLILTVPYVNVPYCALPFLTLMFITVPYLSFPYCSSFSPLFLSYSHHLSLMWSFHSWLSFL